MYVIDCGFKQSTIYNSYKYDETGEHDEVKTISHEDVLSLPQELPTGSTVVCEYAHLGCPRKEKSLAQVFTEGELLNLYEGFESNDITLKLFPSSLRRGLAIILSCLSQTLMIPRLSTSYLKIFHRFL